MPHYKNLIFDLDGTLSNPQEGILNSLRVALEKLNIDIWPEIIPQEFIGPPLQQSFEAVYGLDKEQTDKAVEWFRDYYGSKGLFENHIYEGIPELLVSLHASGFRLFVATSKLEKYARLILKHFKIDTYFLDLAGADYTGTLTKANLIASLIEKHQCLKTETVMVGDTAYDIAGAREAEISAIAVGYGFGQKNSLLECNPDYFFESTSELSDFLLQGSR